MHLNVGQVKLALIIEIDLESKVDGVISYVIRCLPRNGVFNLIPSGTRAAWVGNLDRIKREIVSSGVSKLTSIKRIWEGKVYYETLYRKFCILLQIHFMSSPRCCLFLLAASFLLAGDLWAGTVTINSLDLSKAKQGYGSPKVDLAVDNHPLTIAGKVYAHGWGTHADSYLAIRLAGGSNRLTASVGVDDEAGDSLAKVKFLVYGDGKILWQSDDLTFQQQAQPIDVDVTGVDVLLLAVVGTGDGNRFDHADWIDAKLEVTGASPISIDPPNVDPADILTPPVPDTPRINGPKIFGVRPSSPFLYTIPVSGKRPMQYGAIGLPAGLRLDTSSGEISGVLGAAGTYDVTLQAKNDLGEAKRKFRIAVGDQIALTPPMGWSSWNCWFDNIDQDKITRAAHAMVDSGLSQHGFVYVNVDDTWQGPRGGQDNAIQPDPKRFSDIKAMVDGIHGLGLKAGIYSTPWVTSYGGRIGGSSENPDGQWDDSMRSGPKHQKQLPFALGKYHFFTQDAKQWGKWGFDYLKFDWCPNELPETKEMSDALKASGRDIVFSLSNNSNNTLLHDLPQIAPVANLWRISGDINDSWGSLSNNAMNKDSWSSFNQPGNYNDPDMMVLGFTFGHPTHLTHNEQYTHMSLWCLLSAPLLLGCDLEKLDAFTKSLVTNDEVLDIDQDTLCKQAMIVSKQGQNLVYAKLLEDGSLAVGLFNLGPVANPVTVQWTDLKISGKHVVRDLWRQKDLGTYDDSFSSAVGSHGVVLIKIQPSP
jgi:alpha-galactosidase